MTATAVLILQQEGKLSVDDPVAKYIPELGQLKGADGKPAVVTLKHLLTHTSGMVLDADAKTAKEAEDPGGFDSGVCFKAPLRFEPGTKWEYCQSGINSLGRVVEIVSGKSLPEFFEERICKPLGMKDTTFLSDRSAGPTNCDFLREERGQAHGSRGTAASRSSITVTSHDRYLQQPTAGFSQRPRITGRFCRMLLNEGELDSAGNFKAGTVKLMRTVQTAALKTGFTAGNGWGLGVCVVKEPQGVTGMLSPARSGMAGLTGRRLGSIRRRAWPMC